MKNFKITIQQLREKDFFVRAENRNEALDIAEDKYKGEEFTLDDDYHFETEIECAEEAKAPYRSQER